MAAIPGSRLRRGGVVRPHLVHELLIVDLREHVPTGVLSALVIIPLALMAAVTLHLLVERPMNHLLRDRALSLALAPPRTSALPASARRPDTE
jgi:peptidoglycan/LPS O-acetylase OafA/YrhL